MQFYRGDSDKWKAVQVALLQKFNVEAVYGNGYFLSRKLRSSLFPSTLLCLKNRQSASPKRN